MYRTDVLQQDIQQCTNAVPSNVDCDVLTLAKETTAHPSCSQNNVYLEVDELSRLVAVLVSIAAV